MSLACRGTVIGAMRTTIENKQSNAMPNNFEKRVRSFFRNGCKCLPWILCARECPTFLSVLNRNNNTTCSTSHDTGTTASPHCILLARQLIMPACSYVPPQIEHKHVTETARRRSATHTMSLALSRGETTSPTFSHLPVRSTGSWHRPRHLNLRGAFWAVASCSVQRSCQRDVALCTGGEHSVCNSELKQSSLVLTLCRINLRTTCARFPRHRHE